MTKANLKKIEQDFKLMIEIEQVGSDVLRPYVINTIHGKLSVWFDYEGAKTIFTRFLDGEDVKVDGVSVNQFSGKMNFHGDYGINDFVSVMKRLAT